MAGPAVTVDFAQAADTEAIMRFVREHWSARHVLGHSRALFDWQHAAGDRCNFVLGRTAAEGIVGVLGFIPLSRYDATLAAGRETLWLTTWKVREEVARGLGLRLLLHLQKTHPDAWIGTVGLNPATRGIYDALGYRTGALTRFALVRPAGPAPVLAVWPPGWTPPRAAAGGTAFSAIGREDFLRRSEGLGLDESGVVPAKTRAYVQRRYLDHPFYDYRAWLASEGGRHAVLVTRMCTHAGAGALRVVDFIGEPSVLAGAGPAFEDLLRDSGAEYLDFFAGGLEAELSAAGLFDAAQVPGLVLPGHFEPFDPRNVALLYSLRGADGRRVFCKGDADQDRPNQLPAAS